MGILFKRALYDEHKVLWNYSYYAWILMHIYIYAVNLNCKLEYWFSTLGCFNFPTLSP